MSRRAVVCGVGMVPFAKPGASEHYYEMGEKAARAALEDAHVDYKSVQQAYVGYVYGDSTCGQSAVYRLGMTGIPVFNLNNNCSTGSSALYLARIAVESGQAECVLALGFEEMRPGALRASFPDRPTPTHKVEQLVTDLQGFHDDVPVAAQWFGGAAREYAEKYGMSATSFGMVSVKARTHAARNPFAVFRQPITIEQVMSSPHIYGPLTRLQCCPPTCGAAAAIVCSPEFAEKIGASAAAVPILAQAMTTDFESTMTDRSMMKITGYDMTAAAAKQVYEAAGIGPEDIRVAELHDCFASNEVLSYEALGLTPPGTAERFIRDADNTYGGKVVTNPSGGLLSKGHPLGATGLAQCYELVQQMRGTAGARQVESARVALQHNLGLGGACVVTLYGQPT